MKNTERQVAHRQLPTLGDQILEPRALANLTERIERPEFGEQKVVAVTSEKVSSGFQGSSREVAILRVELRECSNETIQILVVSGVNNVQIEGCDRRAIENRGDAP